MYICLKCCYFCKNIDSLKPELDYSRFHLKLGHLRAFERLLCNDRYFPNAPRKTINRMYLDKKKYGPSYKCTGFSSSLIHHTFELGRANTHSHQKFYDRNYKKLRHDYIRYTRVYNIYLIW